MNYNIDKSSPIPYYYQIQLHLKNAIEKGQWKTNSFIPSERDLANKFDVSRISVKKAIFNLTSEGHLKTIKGKGAMVSQSKIEEHFFYNVISSFQELRERGHKLENRIINFEVIHPKRNIMENLGLFPGEKIYYIERMRLLNDAPYHYTKSYLPYDLYSNLTVEDLVENSIYDLITKKYKQKITKIDKIFEAGKTSFEDSKLFATGINFPILFFVNKTYDMKNKPIEFSHNKIRGDLSKFKVVTNVNKYK